MTAQTHDLTPETVPFFPEKYWLTPRKARMSKVETMCIHCVWLENREDPQSVFSLRFSSGFQ